jgi:hypothetical protein
MLSHPSRPGRKCVPGEIVVALFPKFPPPGFRSPETPFPEFPEILEKDEHECATRAAKPLRGRSPPTPLGSLRRRALRRPEHRRVARIAEFAHRGLKFRRFPTFARISEEDEPGKKRGRG